MQERRCDIKREGKFKECNKAKNEHEKDIAKMSKKIINFLIYHKVYLLGKISHKKPSLMRKENNSLIDFPI